MARDTDPFSAHMLIGDFVKLGSELTTWFEAFLHTMQQRSDGRVAQRQGGLPHMYGPQYQSTNTVPRQQR
jgi:hypothetical protein